MLQGAAADRAALDGLAALDGRRDHSYWALRLNPQEAIALFRSLGLEVECDPTMTHLFVAADRREPAPEVRRHGVDEVFGFGFTVRLVGGTWFLRGGPQSSEEFSSLDEAVARGLELYRVFMAKDPSR